MGSHRRGDAFLQGQLGRGRGRGGHGGHLVANKITGRAGQVPSLYYSHGRHWQGRFQGRPVGGGERAQHVAPAGWVWYDGEKTAGREGWRWNFAFYGIF